MADAHHRVVNQTVVMHSRGHDDEEAASRLLPSAPTSPTVLGSISPPPRPRRCWKPLALTLLMVNLVSAILYVIPSSNASKDQGVSYAVEAPPVPPSSTLNGHVGVEMSSMEPISSSMLEARPSSPQGMEAPRTSATPLQAAQRNEFCAKIDRMLVEFPHGFLPSHLKVMSVEPKPDTQQPHLLGEGRLARSYHRPSPQDPTATACHAHRLFRKLAWPDGENVLIDVIGTSVTHGSWCTKKKGHEPLCAWPERLHRYLTQAFPDCAFTLINSARAGGNIKCFAEDDIYWLRWQKGKVDLLLADHELNNIVLVEKAAGRSIPIAASEGAKWTRTFLDRLQRLERPPSLAFVKTFILSKEAQDCQTSCPTEHWQGKDFCACNWWWDMHDWDKQELHRRRVPVISYRDAVWPVFTNMTDSFKPTYWPCVSDGIHPSWETHRVYADMVAHGLLHMLHDVCHSSAILSPTDEPPAQCSMPDTATESEEANAAQSRETGGGSVAQCRADGRVSVVMSAEDKEGTQFEASVRTGGWAFKEDEKHRKSWTIEMPTRGRGSDAKATIGFPITILEDAPTLIEVTYLKSNRGIGDVRVYTSAAGPSAVSSSEPCLTLKGTWDEQYSLPQTVKIVIPSKNGDLGSMDGGDPDLLYLPSAASGPTTLYFELLRPAGRPKDAQTRFNLFELINCELDR